MTNTIDFAAIEQIFAAAEFDSLLEHEVYAVLQAMGIGTPRFRFLPKGQAVKDSDSGLFRFEQDRHQDRVPSDPAQNRCWGCAFC